MKNSITQDCRGCGCSSLGPCMCTEHWHYNNAGNYNPDCSACYLNHSHTMGEHFNKVFDQFKRDLDFHSTHVASLTRAAVYNAITRRQIAKHTEAFYLASKKWSVERTRQDRTRGWIADNKTA